MFVSYVRTSVIHWFSLFCWLNNLVFLHCLLIHFFFMWLQACVVDDILQLPEYPWTEELSSQMVTLDPGFIFFSFVLYYPFFHIGRVMKVFHLMSVAVFVSSSETDAVFIFCCIDSLPFARSCFITYVWYCWIKNKIFLNFLFSLCWHCTWGAAFTRSWFFT